MAGPPAVVFPLAVVIGPLIEMSVEAAVGLQAERRLRHWKSVNNIPPLDHKPHDCRCTADGESVVRLM